MIALEVAVLERVILDLHGEPLVGHVVRRTLRHGPRREHAVHLEAEVEVQLAGGVLVDDEQPAGDGRHRSRPARASVSGDRLARYVAEAVFGRLSSLLAVTRLSVRR